jgi:ATP-dependent DNA helicase RecG
MVYFLPWLDRQGVSIFESEVPPPSSLLASIPPELSIKPPELTAIPPELASIPPGFPNLYLEWSQLSDELQRELKTIAQVVREHKRVSPELLRATILKLCQGRYLGRRVLAQVLKRNQDDLLKRTLNPLVAESQLKTAFPSSSDPRQAYTASSGTE